VSPGFGRVALVSGGSRGIGAATVRRLAADGWDVSFCHHRDEQAAAETEKAAFELGARALAVQADLTAVAEVGAWVRRAEDDLGPAQAVVSCAGITRDQPITLLTDADWRAVTDTSLAGVFRRGHDRHRGRGAGRDQPAPGRVRPGRTARRRRPLLAPTAGPHHGPFGQKRSLRRTERGLTRPNQLKAARGESSVTMGK